MKARATVASAWRRRDAGYLIIEALVYIFAVFILLLVAYSAMYRCVEKSTALRHSADDITAALRAGERWRADVRSAAGSIRARKTEAGEELELRGPRDTVTYLYTTNAVLRRMGQRAWEKALINVKSSNMESDPRQTVSAWRWELELQPRLRATRLRPLFTFIAVAATDTNSETK